MKQPQITEEMIDALDVEPRVYERGEDYFENGAVLGVKQRGDLLSAEVQGSDDEPYRVTIRLNKQGISATDCTCPYTEEWSGVCKHVVAVLLTLCYDEADVEQRPSVAELIADLDAQQLRKLLAKLAERDPAVADAIDELVRR